ncbi:MAG: hypothetical protein D6B26_07585, partial [Spirochaetaceae bacterium]
MEPVKIGPYEIVDTLGEGGMGIVYKAVDRESERIVAIKTLKDSVDPASETFLRFKKEAQLLEELNHPGILKFIEFKEQNGRLYIVTEYLRGSNLKQVIRDNIAIPADQKAQLLMQIARALDYVHSKGIIHRDIKPSNIMVSEDLQKARILDFGVANLMNIQKMFNTQQEGVVGSFAYMSPEQSGILKRNIDTRSDLYSLGIMFYQFVTGRLPYRASEVGELIHQHIAKNPVPPGEIIDGLSFIVNKIILKLMKKDPDDRYQTAFGLAEDLETYLGLTEEQKENFYLELGKKDRLKNLNYSTQLVGRNKETRRLLEHLNQTILGKGWITAIIGKSAIGKSRLVGELQKFTGSKKAYMVGVVSSERSQNNPYFPFLEVIKRIVELVARLPEIKRNAIYQELQEKLGKEGAILSRVVPQLEPILGAYSSDMKFVRHENEIFFEKVRDFLLVVADPTQPFVISFDDAHFWDHGSVQLLSYLQDYLADSSLYIVISLREEEVNRVEELMKFFREEAQADKLDIIHLHELPSDSIGDLVSEIFGGMTRGLDQLCDRLYESTQGNPLLIIENIKTLVEEGILVQRKDQWQVELSALAEFKFSSSLADKIAGRLDQVHENTKRALRIAAILGKDFSFALLSGIVREYSPDISDEILLDCLAEGIEARLIGEGLSESGEVLYFFVHDRVMETLLETMNEQEIQDIHGIAASQIEDNYSGSDRVYKLAYHYLMARNDEKACYFNNQAGQTALESYSFKLAVSFFGHALQIMKKDEQARGAKLQERVELALQVAGLNFQLGDYLKNIELLEALLKDAEQLEDKTRLANAMYLLAKNYFFTGNQAKGMEFYYKLVPVAEQLNIPELLAIPYCAIGRAHCFMANFQEAIEYIEKGLAILPAEEVLEQVYSLGILAQSYAYVGMKARAFDMLEQLDEMFGSTENEMFQLYIQFYRASVFAMVGNPQTAIEESEKTMELAREQKNLALGMFSQYFVGLGYSFQGKAKSAIYEITKAIKLAEDNNLSMGMFMVYYNLAEACAAIGNIDLAEESLEKGKQLTAMANKEIVEQWELRIRAIAMAMNIKSDAHKAIEYSSAAIAISKKMGDFYRYSLAQN